MVVIRFQGGLGNQMFQYALYEELKQRGIVVKADLTVFGRDVEQRAFELTSVFNIQLDRASKEEIFKLAGGENNLLEGMVRQLLKKRTYKREELLSIHELQEGIDNVYLDGYWQKETYFSHVKDKIRKNFCFKDQSVKNTDVYQRICDSNSVAIHVRMGDYIKYQSIYGNICTYDYYIKAIQYVQQLIPDATFFVFSDELDKAKLFLQGIKAEFVNTGMSNSQDMQLISCCKHNIIANSSFSWWAAWLNSNENKIVVAPKKWDNIGKSDVACNDWILI